MPGTFAKRLQSFPVKLKPNCEAELINSSCPLVMEVLPKACKDEAGNELLLLIAVGFAEEQLRNKKQIMTIGRWTIYFIAEKVG